MNTERLQELQEALRLQDERIQDFRDSLANPMATFTVASSDFRKGRRVSVEITFEMAEPFLRIGLRTAERKRTAIAEAIRAL